MGLVFRLLGSLGSFFILMTVFKTEPDRITLLGSHANLIATGAIALIAPIFPKFFDMGIQGFRKSGILKRLVPFLYVILLLFVNSKLPQTPATTYFVAYILGVSCSYTGRILSATLVNQNK